MTTENATGEQPASAAARQTTPAVAQAKLPADGDATEIVAVVLTGSGRESRWAV